jgi:hypothetical protein
MPQNVGMKAGSENKQFKTNAKRRYVKVKN